ncbi:orotate phosphoribosyltransferase [Lewinellaceae bacterium SD302]|nr:orotate phosphoribosyltransferase [Lewinellaceae bacterium SD302]
MVIAKQIARRLLEIGAVKLSPETPFTWASGWRSPIYCDNRIILSHPEVRSEVRDALIEAAKTYGQVDGIAGVATAGIPHGAMLADHLNLPFIYIRSQAKGHGRQNRIEGELIPGGNYLLIEDLISTGGSVLEAATALRDAGGTVAGVQAIFTYEFQKSVDAFAAANTLFSTLSNYTSLLEVAVEEGKIAPDLLETLSEWRNDPGGWMQA